MKSRGRSKFSGLFRVCSTPEAAIQVTAVLSCWLPAGVRRRGLRGGDHAPFSWCGCPLTVSCSCGGTGIVGQELTSERTLPVEERLPAR